MKRKFFSLRTMAVIAVMSALAGVLMCVDIPISFIAPTFYKADLGDLPALIGSFACGPIAGALIELLKVLIKLLIKPTTSAYVGEMANLLCGLCLVVPAGIIYKKNHSKKGAIKALIVGSISYVTVGTLLNYFVLIPAYSVLYKMPIEAIIDMGSKIFPIIHDKFTFCLICVLPFNIIKIVVVSALTFLLYKRISHLLQRTFNRVS